ncbi:hypothetical protein SODALDRAFT_266785 [Sodiomyces alkalinus F11]|uniref:FAD-binding FR-type domain-containing protein n=1 Tax=Sodiomyces alkalinus (strain CBS 110278 / VKM F-3762 / F11) TaxID=1314773 RepID=A0A3N2Q683_SODAK|nr:hypothetical protein SODALDRAFT_266785 [Sodiomyces alkalinus F11]ROT42207.1 hypothetical protein SODALDRAFT_266785 [Sodiomyces alkalinus F11]
MRPRSVVFALTAAVPCRAVGLTGIDTFPENPLCAQACYNSLATYRLDCSIVHEDDSRGHHHAHVMTSPECRAGNEHFLRSLAWCISTKCADAGLSTPEIEEFWFRVSTDDPAVPPQWSYTEALRTVEEPPVRELGHGDTINATVRTPEFWSVLYGTQTTLYHETRNGSIFGLVILLTGFGIPILLSWLGRFPYIGTLYDRINPYLVYPSLIGTYQVRPLPYQLGNAPTIGQGLYIGLMVVVNVIVSAVDYRTTPAHLWFQSTSQQVAGYLMYRTGVLSFSMAPLLILFAGRNNILQWLTDWPHSTFLLLHRWIARLFVLQALLHTILAVAVYAEMGIYEAESVLDYWVWGVVATVLACLMCVASVGYFRRLSYEIFLVGHVVMAVFVIVGCWYHVIYRFDISAGYTTWLYAACAVWFFDRLVRVGRILKTGVRYAEVTDVGDHHVRVDIEGIRWGAAPGKHAYVYFPGLNPLRPWENHPFSVLPTSLFRPPTQQCGAGAADATAASSTRADSEQNDVEKSQASPAVTVLGTCSKGPPAHRTTAGVTFFVRKSEGMTKSLRTTHGRLLALLDGPYPNNSVQAVLKCDRVLLITGGIGITGVLPWVQAHSNARLCWSIKERDGCLVDALDGVLQGVAEKDVKRGQRIDVEAILNQEVEAGWTRIGVVACGPGGLCDHVRAAVAAAGRKHSTVFELEVHAYSW